LQRLRPQAVNQALEILDGTFFQLTTASHLSFLYDQYRAAAEL
jgi:hypothetical protein